MSKETLACLIIDDPFLCPKYGAFKYEDLLDILIKHRFFAEIAFIPWNHKRNSAKTVELFKNNPDYLSICVHGCYHTRNEFGITDYNQLTKLASTSMFLMKSMEVSTGLKFDPVMVFPQGLFSSVAMKVLKEQGFSAAFNSGIVATDDHTYSKEYNSAPVKTYHDFPLFLRRYPKDRVSFLDDIKNNRPIIIVEHSSVFKDGYDSIIDLVDWINSKGDIKWVSLSKIVERYSQLVNHNDLTYEHHVFPNKYKVKVLLRRLLSEFRDNILQTNNPVGTFYRILKK